MESGRSTFAIPTASLLCAVFSSIGAFLLGFDTGIFSTTIAHLSFKIYMYQNELGNAVLTGTMASTYTAGTAIGGLSSGWMAGRFGRKKCIIGSAAIVIVGTIIQTAAINIGMLVAGRVIAGLPIGVLLSIVPVYNAELALPKYRGMIVGLFAAMASFGVLCSNWVGYACFFATGNAQWRIPLGCKAPFAVILFIGGFFLPESPRWLIKKDRDQEAYEILMRVHGVLGEEYVNREFTQMHEQISIEGQGGFRECFKTPSARKRIALGTFITVFNNLGGTPVITAYQSQLFTQIGFPGLQTLFFSGFYGLAGFIGVLINIGLVADRMGRRTSMWIGAIMLLIDLIILMPLSKLYTGSTNEAGKAAAVAFIFVHSFVYSVFMFGTVWVYLSEIFPTKLRAQGLAISTFWGQVISVILQQVGLQVYNDIGYLFYIVFILCTAAAGFVYYFFLPETNGVTLEDISAFFGDEVATLHESKTRIERILNGATGCDDEPSAVLQEHTPATPKGMAVELEDVSRV
ncbi:hypothetical protein V500_05566 [Pseudogymnoascus sp. VKM F-4518 (FW-2643)]|nr:hypothetical protein V500_05566 [Pseudogymnoascus sp. VKM F-4518 (FW-2643)]